MIIQQLGLKNFVIEHGVTSTRTTLYIRPDEKFADSIFMSPDI